MSLSNAIFEQQEIEGRIAVAQQEQIAAAAKAAAGLIAQSMEARKGRNYGSQARWRHGIEERCRIVDDFALALSNEVNAIIYEQQQASSR